MDWYIIINVDDDDTSLSENVQNKKNKGEKEKDLRSYLHKHPVRQGQMKNICIQETSKEASDEEDSNR